MSRVAVMPINRMASERIVAFHRVVHGLAVRFPTLRGALDIGNEKRDRAGRTRRNWRA